MSAAAAAHPAGQLPLRRRIGPFNVAINGDNAALEAQLAQCYPDYAPLAADAFIHAGVSIRQSRGGAGEILLDDGTLFTDFPAGQALPYVEWALNWCIATRCHHLLMLHAAVVEKGGRAVILPGLPGAGKSTLAAYLAHRGWRLLSDEFCLLRPGSNAVIPFPRLIPLKNESIAVMAEQVPEARIGPIFSGTRKGDVAHVTPPAAQALDSRTARPALVVMPGYAAGADDTLTPLPAARCFVELSKNAFNYQVMGRDGFLAVADIVDAVRTYSLRYSRLEQAAALIETALSGD